MHAIMWQLRALVGVLIFTVILQVFAFVTPWWGIVSVNIINVNIGLWQACVGPNCRVIPLGGDLEFLAVRGLVVCGLVVSLSALVIGSRVLCFIRGNAPIPSNLVAFPVLSIIAGSCSIIGCGIFGSEMDGASSSVGVALSSSFHLQLHVSFASAVIAAIVQIILGTIGLVLRSQNFNDGAPPTHSFTEFQNVVISPSAHG